MKKNTLLSTLILFLALVSCNKFLNIKPLGLVVPTTIADYNQELVAAYQAFPKYKSILAFRTDELILNTSDGNDLTPIRDIYQWNDRSPSPNTLSYPWVTLYKEIFYANHIIQTVFQNAGISAETQQILGEAYMLRAYSHFELLNLYTPTFNPEKALTQKAIPLSKHIDLEQIYPPATTAQVYQLIFDDLNQAEKQLRISSFESKQRYRFSLRALYALRARIHLYRKEWLEAAENAQKTLSLNSDLQDLNQDQGKILPTFPSSKEMILALEETYDSNVTNNAYIDPQFLKKYYPVSGDLRLTSFFSGNENTKISEKRSRNRVQRSTFRNAEMFLIAAEAAAQLNNTTYARTQLLALAKNRLDPDYYIQYQAYTATLTKESLLAEIYNERAREFVVEGHRWYDLRRSSQPRIVHMFNGQESVLQVQDPRYTIYYPKQARENNPALAIHP